MNEKFIIPGSIIVAGAIIGLAVYMGGNQSASSVSTQPTEEGRSEIQAKKVDPASDRIYGSPTAEIFVLEYSDLECPFCKKYNDEILSKLKEEYKDDERVSFVFRHFPLDTPYIQQPLHPSAQEVHVAAECVGKLGGDVSFYTFTDSVFANDTSNPDDLAILSDLAEQAGVNRIAFDTCLGNMDTEKIVKDSFEEGVAAGVEGTPTVYIQTREGKTFQAAADYNVVKTAISAYLSDLQ